MQASTATLNNRINTDLFPIFIYLLIYCVCSLRLSKKIHVLNFNFIDFIFVYFFLVSGAEFPRFFANKKDHVLHPERIVSGKKSSPRPSQDEL